MSYSVMDDVTQNANRLCVYFKFDEAFKISYAAKQKIGEDTSSVKCEFIHEIVSWLGFSDIAHTLFKSPKFKNRFHPKFTTIIPDQLIIGELKKEHFFFIKNQNTWSSFESIKDHNLLQNEDVQESISSIMGRDFIHQHEEFLATQKVISQNLTEGLSQMRKFNTDIANGLYKNPTPKNQELRVVDINESVSFVAH